MVGNAARKEDTHGPHESRRVASFVALGDMHGGGQIQEAFMKLILATLLLTASAAPAQPCYITQGGLGQCHRCTHHPRLVNSIRKAERWGAYVYLLMSGNLVYELQPLPTCKKGR